MTPSKLLKTLLKNPSSISSKSHAKQLHSQLIKHKGNNPYHTSIILSIYSNLNLLNESINCFDTLQSPPLLAWKSMIRCYTNLGFCIESLTCFRQMRVFGLYPDHNVFPSVIKSCTLIKSFKLAESVHACVIQLGLDIDVYTGNALMNMYAKLENFGENVGDKGHDHQVFDEMLCRKLDYKGCDNVSRIGAECDGVGEFDKLVVGYHPKFNLDVMDSNGLSQSTGESGGSGCRKSGVQKVFEMMPMRDLVSWNTVIAGNAQNGMFGDALAMLRDMGQANLKPDTFSLSSVLPVFAELVNIDRGKEIHGYAIKNGLVADLHVGSGLVNMYAKCNKIEDAYKVFSLLPLCDSISWNSIIAGCVQNGLFDEGLKLFRKMIMAKVKLGSVSFSSIIPACAHLTTLRLGKQLHGYIIRCGFEENVLIASSLIDMYAKCGYIMIARRIFNKMQLHDTVSWTAMIMGYAVHGHADDAISLFKQMETEGVKPNSVAFIAVLTACSHAGLVDDAWHYFNSMRQVYGLSPQLEHYAAVADLLGRAGRLKEAYEFVCKMPAPRSSIWPMLLSACRAHKDVEMAEIVAGEVFKVDPSDMGAYVLLANTYSAAKRWRDAAKVRVTMRNKGIMKAAACSWIEVQNKLHAFVSGDKSHPCYEKIKEVQEELLEQMEKEGYVPDTSELFQHVDEEYKIKESTL